MGSPRLCAASSTAHTARCTVGACASSATRRSAAWQQPPAGARARTAGDSCLWVLGHPGHRPSEDRAKLHGTKQRGRDLVYLSFSINGETCCDG